VVEQSPNFVKGLLAGCILAVPLWIGVILVAVEVCKALAG